MRPYELPLIEEGTAEEQLRQIKSFLYRQAENLNYNLKNSDVTSLWRQTAEALSVSDNEEVEQMRRDEFQALRGLIIKSATSIIKNEDSFSAHFAGDYTAESDYGTFTEEGNIFINGNPYTIGQIYKYQAQIVTDVSKYKTNMEGFIKTGVLERETSNPVFGMEIGYNKNTYTVGETVYQNSAPAKIRITPLRIGFWQNGFEAAYIENKAIYFPAAHITGGSIEIGDNFSVDNQGNMKALNAVIKGTVHARSGIIGGFETRGASSSEGNFWPCSFSSILTPTDGNPNDDYQYVVFIRGNYTEDGGNYGAIDTTHNVFGIKKRAQTVTSWENDVAPYVYRVTVKGEVFCTSVTAGNIEGSYIKANESNVILGRQSPKYSKNIGFYTSGEIYIGTYNHKASNVYVMASGTVRIGQHTEPSAQSGSANYPSTKNVLIQASEVFMIGSSGYEVAKAYFYANSTQFSGVIAPVGNEEADLGHTSYKWNNIYSKYLSASASGCNVGSDSYGSPINIKTSGNLTLGGLVGKEYKEYTFSTIISYMQTSRSLITTMQGDVGALSDWSIGVSASLNNIDKTFLEYAEAINNHSEGLNNHEARLKTIETRLGIQ